MSDYTPKEGTGQLFVNKKRDKDTHPHQKGQAMIGGVLHDIAAWEKEGRGGKFLSLSIKPARRGESPKNEGGPDAMEPRGYQPLGEQLDDEIPF